MLIDYEQLGLKFRLYSCEVLFNRGLCYLYLGQTEKGLDDFAYAAKEKQTEEHDVIDEAMNIQGQVIYYISSKEPDEKANILSESNIIINNGLGYRSIIKDMTLIVNAFSLILTLLI